MFEDLFAQLTAWSEQENPAIWEQNYSDDWEEMNTERTTTDNTVQFQLLNPESHSIDEHFLSFNDVLSEWNSENFNGFGDPIADADFWQAQQGQNSCAVVAQIGVYEAITGQDLSEADACRFAKDNGWFDPDRGTQPEDMGKLLDALGIPTYQTYDASLEDIATALERGDKVIVGLDAQEIWYPLHDPVIGEPLEQPTAGHAVWVTGIDQEPDGSIKLILNDSGAPNGRMMAVDAPDFLNAWQDFGNLLVIADAPAPVAVAQAL